MNGKLRGILRILPVFVLIVLNIQITAVVFAEDQEIKAPKISSETGCLMDADSGEVLFDKKMDQRMYPASTTKVMTCLLALEHGNPDDVVTMTETGVAYTYGDSSNQQTVVGEEILLKDALYAVMLPSANDIATQVGEFIGGGSLDTFISMMNERAAQIGCKDTHFTNACGMPDENHWTTAYDMALMFREALKNQQFREIIATKEYTMPATNMSGPRTFTNHTLMLVQESHYYEGMLGGKPGHTDAAGYTLVTAIDNSGYTLIASTMNAPSLGHYCEDHKKLYDYGLAYSKARASSIEAEATETEDMDAVVENTDPVTEQEETLEIQPADEAVTGESGDGNTQVMETENTAMQEKEEKTSGISFLDGWSVSEMPKAGFLVLAFIGLILFILCC